VPSVASNVRSAARTAQRDRVQRGVGHRRRLPHAVQRNLHDVREPQPRRQQRGDVGRGIGRHASGLALLEDAMQPQQDAVRGAAVK
jgi:hypothetical protein